MIPPYISREDVSAALSSLIHHSREPEFNGLRHLLLVDLRLASPEMPAGDTIREYAVRDLLLTQIIAALSEHRLMFSLPLPDTQANLPRTRSEAAQAVEQGAHELLVWSVLYYRCVRVDLDLSVEELAALLALHERTLSRYFIDGVDLLTERLIRAESAARLAQLERLLYASLPSSVPQRLFGRADLLITVERALSARSPRHCFITGAAGIGKSAFVQELVRGQISAASLDHVIWIEQPDSVDFVRQHLAETLLREASEISLREYLLMHSVAVILDGIGRAADDRAAFDLLLRDLSAASVYLVNRAYLPLDSIEIHVELPQIDSASASLLVAALLPAAELASTQELAAALYEQVGGNPLALKLALGLWVAGDDTLTIESELHGRLFIRLFEELSDSSRQAWCALALIPQSIEPGLLSRTWGIPIGDVNTLGRHGLTETTGEGQVRLVGAAREAVRQAYYEHVMVRRHVDYLITGLTELSGSFEVIEQALASGFPEISLELRHHWVILAWREGFRRSHWALWRTILETELANVTAFIPELHVAYAMCLRRLGEWDAASHVFRQVVAESGRHGQFAEQGRALAEWSILARYQSDYRHAREMITQAKRYAQRSRDSAMLSELALHEAQLLILQGQGREAVELLASQPDSLRVITLQSEAQLALGNYDACRQLAQRALRLAADDQASKASLYTIFGRSFQAQESYQHAQPPMTDAVTLLERLDDSFSLARAQTNLAAVLIPLERFADAAVLLARAEQIQLRLGDRVGLMATRHNRTLLGGHFAG